MTSPCSVRRIWPRTVPRRRLRQDGLVAGAAALAHRAAPAVEHAQLDAVAGGKFVEEFDEGNPRRGTAPSCW